MATLAIRRMAREMREAGRNEVDGLSHSDLHGLFQDNTVSIAVKSNGPRVVTLALLALPLVALLSHIGTCFIIPLKKACARAVLLIIFPARRWGEVHMKTLLASLATCAAVFSCDASAGAASLVSIQGAVQINSGSGFHQVAGATELAPGNSVMVGPGASAEIRYSGDCRIPVRPGSVEVVARLSPCGPPPIRTAVQGGTLVGADPDTFVRSQLLRDNRDSLY